MILNKTTVRSAVALAIVGCTANAAYAIPLSSFAANAATNVVVQLSGSTALDGTLLNASLETAGPGGLCLSQASGGSIDYYQNAAKTQEAVYCTATTTAGALAAGNPLLILKESVVGSVNGVQPLINAAGGNGSAPTGLNFFVPSLLAADSSCSNTPKSANPTANLGGYTAHTGCTGADVTTSNNEIPTAGISDVEPAILKGPGTASAGTAVVGDQTTVTASQTLDQVWALALDKNLYYLLQSAEGLTGSCPSSGFVGVAGVTYPAPNPWTALDDPSCAPSLSRAQVTSLIAGNVTTVTQLIGGAAAATLTDKNIYACIRDNGSGTEASFEYYFTGERCSLSGLSHRTEDAKKVFASGSGGGVRNCLQFMQAGGTVSAYYSTKTLVVAPTATKYAYGFLNTEITAANLSSAGDAFRFVAIDGALPQIANVQNGTYPYFSTGQALVMNTGSNLPSAAAAQVVSNLFNLIGHPIWTHDSNASYAQNPWGVAGDVSPAGLYALAYAPTLPATAATLVTGYPTNAFTKTSGTTTNNCNAPAFDEAHLGNVSAGAVNMPVETKLFGTVDINN
jgi:hypothetical protein